MNIITLTGNIGRDPEVRTTANGTLVASFSLAVRKQSKDEDSEWFDVKVFGKQAEFVSTYLTKGRKVAVSGRMESRKFVDKEGVNRKLWEVTANSVEPLDKAPDNASDRTNSPPPAQAAAAPAQSSLSSDDDYDPFADN